MRNYPIWMCLIIALRANEMNFFCVIPITDDPICLRWDAWISLFSPDNLDQVSWKVTFWNIAIKQDVRIREVYFKRIWIVLWLREQALSTNH